ncbi:MAG TPA: C39 family peptidase [Chthoniobacterales bacterium]
MKRKYLLPLIAVVSAFCLSGCCRPSTILGNVPNTLRPQETDNWCWAATTQMLSQHLGLSITQCALANHSFNKTNCCTEQNAGTPCPKTADCNTPGWVDLDFAGAKSAESVAALTWTKLKKQIFCTKKPMGYAYGTDGVVGHVVVIKGYVSVGDTNYLLLNDPWAPCGGRERLITYEEYADPAGSSTHWNTWYDIAKK